MFYRRKLILAILECFGGQMPKINIQKIAFLITNRQANPIYEFIPYKFGAYSYSANADLSAMIKHGLITENEKGFKKSGTDKYFDTLTPEDKKLLLQVTHLFKDHDANALMKHTYINYPYYAINSTTANRLLTDQQLQVVASSRPTGRNTILFTIGYEGVSVEAYLNKLIRNDIKVLVDVRNNPLSQKYGFSKTLLQKHCGNLNIEYVHFGDVGIQSALRQILVTQDDYDQLFNSYKETTLVNTISTQEKILDLLVQKKRVALTCFEANICQCHRKHLSEAITRLPGWDYEMKHI